MKRIYYTVLIFVGFAFGHGAVQSVHAELGKTYSEANYGGDFKSSISQSRTLAQWKNNDWRIIEIYSDETHKATTVTIAKINGDLTNVEMAAIAKKQGISLENWQPLGTLGEENSNYYRTKDGSFIVECIRKSTVMFLPVEELALHLSAAHSAEEALRRLRGQ
jgi:hypothetical protein